jgi:aminoglycoside phosphotransferase family enzyme
MNSRQIDLLRHEGVFPHPFLKRELVETHISYVLLGSGYAYKFKKSIRYSFADFSTLAKRKYYCEREVLLNNRLSKGLYLGVVPVCQRASQLIVDSKDGTIIDYAVKMKRLQSAKQMHLMLDEGLVTQKHIRQLALMIRKFHAGAEVVHSTFQEDHFANRFNDLLSISAFVQSSLGRKYVAILRKAVRISDAFLHKHRDLFIRRFDEGYVRDVHGDLHSRNIFLYAQPIIFDCLEFNDEFRKTDVLDELAFFCMDLDAEGYFALSKSFTDFYFSGRKEEFGLDEHLLFSYYKCYRANVRAKVNALRAMKPDVAVRKGSIADVRKYLDLMEGYLEILE